MKIDPGWAKEVIGVPVKEAREYEKIAFVAIDQWKGTIAYGNMMAAQLEWVEAFRGLLIMLRVAGVSPP